MKDYSFIFSLNFIAAFKQREMFGDYKPVRDVEVSHVVWTQKRHLCFHVSPFLFENFLALAEQ